MAGIDQSTDFINKIYDGLTYFDQYGGSLIFFFFVTLVVFYIYAYCIIWQQKEEIVKDWTNQRCNPKVMPFAGWLNAPKGTSASKYTSDNFQYCVQSTLTNISGIALQPFNYLISSLTNTFSSLTDGVNNSRNIMANLRENVRKIIVNIMTRILNVVIPIQRIFIALIDTLNKTQGIITASLFTALGSYMTLQSLMGAMMELMIKLLVVMAAVVTGLWAVPPMWGVAASTSAVFLSISIPLAIIVGFMSEVLHIKTSALPSLPKMRCFDRRTPIMLYSGVRRNIENIIVGDILHNGDVVTATVKVTAKYLKMYNLNGTIISESHKVKNGNEWVQVSEHPLAILLTTYTEPYLYCINTTSKTINIDGTIFCDWDEVYAETLSGILAYLTARERKSITTGSLHEYVDVGFPGDAIVKMDGNKYRYINTINIGDITSDGAIVYGIVRLGEGEQLYNLLTTNHKITAVNTVCSDYNGPVDEIICQWKS